MKYYIILYCYFVTFTINFSESLRPKKANTETDRCTVQYMDLWMKAILKCTVWDNKTGTLNSYLIFMHTEKTERRVEKQMLSFLAERPSTAAQPCVFCLCPSKISNSSITWTLGTLAESPRKYNLPEFCSIQLACGHAQFFFLKPRVIAEMPYPGWGMTSGGI